MYPYSLLEPYRIPNALQHSVTKGHYFSKNPMIKKNLQIEIFYTNMVQNTQKRQASIFDSLF